MTPDAARALAGALVMLVVGTIVVMLDLSIGDFDLVADGVGFILIAVAGFRVARAAEAVGQEAARAAGNATGVVASILAVSWLLDVVTGGWQSQVPGGEWLGALLALAPFVIGIWLLWTLSRWMFVASMDEEARRLGTAAVVLGVAWGLLAVLLSVTAALMIDDGPGSGYLAVGLLVLFLAAGAYTAAALLSTARALRLNAELVELQRSGVVAVPEVQGEPTGEERHQ